MRLRIWSDKGQSADAIGKGRKLPAAMQEAASRQVNVLSSQLTPLRVYGRSICKSHLPGITPPFCSGTQQ